MNSKSTLRRAAKIGSGFSRIDVVRGVSASYCGGGGSCRISRGGGCGGGGAVVCAGSGGLCGFGLCVALGGVLSLDPELPELDDPLLSGGGGGGGRLTCARTGDAVMTTSKATSETTGGAAYGPRAARIGLPNLSC